MSSLTILIIALALIIPAVFTGLMSKVANAGVIFFVLLLIFLFIISPLLLLLVCGIVRV